MKTDIELENQTLEYIKSLTLLCVEDDEDERRAYRTIFEDLVDELIFAVDGEDGYDKYLSNSVDIIVTDYYMPKLNGLKMIEKIRENNRHIPIILISVMEDKDVVATGSFAIALQ